MTKEITSFSNPIIKSVRGLHDRKGRQQNGQFLVEGLQAIGMAFDAGFFPELLLHAPERTVHPVLKKLLHALPTKQVIETTPAILSKISARDNAQAVMAVYRQQWAKLPEKPGGVWVALENIKDPGNLGTIMRTADAVGAAGIILVGDSCDPYSVEATRASMGSIFATPIVKLTQNAFTEVATKWRKQGSVLATTLQGSADYRAVKPKQPVLVMMGNEQKGLPDALVDLATDKVKIPMRGTAESLNIAVATAVILYQLYDTAG